MSTPNPYVTTAPQDAPVMSSPRIAWANVERVTEGQFAAVVRGYHCSETDAGLVYTREGQPWRYIRSGQNVTAVHTTFPLPDRYYIIT